MKICRTMASRSVESAAALADALPSSRQMMATRSRQRLGVRPPSAAFVFTSATHRQARFCQFSAIFRPSPASQKSDSIFIAFTPCAATASLLEAITIAAEIATAGDGNFLSPACSSLARFEKPESGDERLCRTVKSISRGQVRVDPNMNGRIAKTLKTTEIDITQRRFFASEFFDGKLRREYIHKTLLMK